MGAIFNCKNRPDIPFKMSFVGLIWTALVVGLGGFYYGITGVALGMIISLVPGYVSIYLACRMINLKIGLLFSSLWPIIFSSILCSIVALWVSHFMQIKGIPLFFTLISSVLLGAVIYMSTIYFLFKELTCDIIKMLENVLGLRVLNFRLVRVK